MHFNLSAFEAAFLSFLQRNITKNNDSENQVCCQLGFTVQIQIQNMNKTPGGNENAAIVYEWEQSFLRRG